MKLCSDCPPVGYPNDKTRCGPCPRRHHEITATGWSTWGTAVPGCEIGAGYVALVPDGTQPDPNCRVVDLARCTCRGVVVGDDDCPVHRGRLGT